MKIKVFLAALCALLLLAAPGRFSAKAQSSVVVQGIAFCYYHPATGVWVASTNVGSGFASWFKVSGDGHIISFRRTMVAPAMMSIHVGCGAGSTPGSWWSDNHTQDIGVDKDMVLKTYCSDTQPGTTFNCQFVPSSEAAAIDWAKPYNGQTQYINQCLQFVADAYAKGAGKDVLELGWLVLPHTSDGQVYPKDIWPGSLKHGQFGFDTSNKTPPAGAWVFFIGTDRTLSHVELSLGGGSMISTYDGYGYVHGYGYEIHTETIDEHDSASANHYAGWWLPDQ